MPELTVAERAVEALAEFNAIEELWGWWGFSNGREARQKKRYAQLSEHVKDSWREGARKQLAVALPHIIAAYEEQPNVLSVGDVRLLRRFHLNAEELEDAEGYAPELRSLLTRLSEWADLHSEGGD